MNSYIKRLLGPAFWIRNKHDDILRKNNPERLFGILYHRVTGDRIHTDNPQTMYDKIAYMLFHTDTTEWSRLADKVAVREYVKDCGFASNLTRLYGVWEHADEIDFDCLPVSFVIKTNNASATNILVKDKTKESLSNLRKQLDEWLMIDYGYNTCTPHYSRIQPLILAEEFLVDEQQKGGLIDYKFHCTNGNPQVVQVMSEREPNTHRMRFMTYDMGWMPHPEYNQGILKDAGLIEKPLAFEKMKAMAETLSKPFPYVRVDFYQINGNPVFGEMTFVPGWTTMSMSIKRIIGHEIKLN